jgi:hypothetical protein
VKGIRQGHHDPGVVILPAPAVRRVGLAAGPAAGRTALRLTEQRFEERAVVAIVAPVSRCAAELVAAVPARRRLKGLSTLRALPHVVVGRAPFTVAQHLVGLVELLHARRGIGGRVDVRMVLAR